MDNNTPEFDFDLSQYESEPEKDFDFDLEQYSKNSETPSVFNGLLENHPSTRAGLLGIKEKAEEYNLPEIMKYAGHAATGATQGISNTAISLANLGLQALPIKKPRIIGEPLNEGESYNESYQIPHINLGQHLEDPGISFLGGNIAGQIAPQAKAMKAIDLIKRPQGYMGILSDLVKGGAAGYALGENEEGDRTLPAILGSLFKGATSLGTKKVANRVVSDMKNVQKEYNGLYDNLFKAAKDSGIEKVNLDKINWNNLFRNATTKQLKSLKDLKANPTLENAHSAQSTIGSIERNLNKAVNKDNPAIRSAEAAKDAVQKSIYKAFEKGKSPQLIKQYQDITAGYAKDVVPYSTNASLGKFMRKEMKAPKLLKSLYDNDKFQLAAGNKYPEIPIGIWGKRLMGIAGSGYGAKKGFEYIKGQ